MNNFIKILSLLILSIGWIDTFAVSEQDQDSQYDGFQSEAAQETPIEQPQYQAQFQQPIPIPNSGRSIPLTEQELVQIEQEKTKNVVKLAATDQLNSEIVTNRTKAYLSCESGEMVVNINFTQPFRGVAYANYDRTSQCRLLGDGQQQYQLKIPLKGCGTKQEAPRLFINNIIFRFHRSLELEEDEIKTIICRYPPPMTQPPTDAVPPPPELPPPVNVVAPPKLSEIELLLIICALLFLTLLLLGIGVAYYCLKRRNIKIIRKKKQPTPPPSDITKVTVSSMIEPIRIPRVQSPPTESETDYPSESPSDDDGRRTIVSETSTIRNDHYRFENSAFLPEPYPQDIEREDSVSSFPVPALYRPEITKQELMTTILETERLTEEDVFNTRHRRVTQKHYRKIPPPPSYSDAPSLRGSIPDNDDWSHSEIDDRLHTRQYIAQPAPQLRVKNLDDTHIDREDDIRTTEDYTRNKLSVVPAPKIIVKKIDDLYVTNISETVTTESIMKTKSAQNAALQAAGAITSSSSATGYKSIEASSSSHIPAPPPPPPPPPPQYSSPSYTPVRPTVTRTSDVTSKSIDERLVSELQQQQQQQQQLRSKSRSRAQESYRSEEMYESDRSDHMLQSARLLKKLQPSSGVGGNSSSQKTVTETRAVAETSSSTTEVVDKQMKFDVLFRILERPPPGISGVDRLTTSEKNRWRTTIATDEVFRSLIIESSTYEEYVQISRDIRYEKLFEPKTWEVIIRILTHSDRVAMLSKRTILDSDTTDSGGDDTTSAARRYRKRSPPSSGVQPNRSEPTSRRSSSVMDYDLRSITEEDVNFTALRREPWSSEMSGTGGIERSSETRIDMMRHSSSSSRANVPTTVFKPYTPVTTSSLSATATASTTAGHSSSGHTVIERSGYVYPQQQSQPLFSSPETQEPQVISLPSQHYSQQYHHLGSASSHHQQQQRHQQQARYGYSHGSSMYEQSSSEMCHRSTHDRASTVGDREDNHSLTETDVYDHRLR
ncbi:uncharacterized protein LOC141856339 [Brevipalpus obovatus]|uniref:uncharacterized protein LOC141856339 n=1 Tax=Brevipalpus obovatus TaxID=246614 RepID=UPI003D9EC6DD